MTLRPAYRLSVRSFVLALAMLGVAPAAWAQLAQSEPPDLGTFSLGEVQRSLRATGGDGTYAWQVIDGALPDGVSLRTDGPPWFPPDASAGLIGVATTPDTYHFTLRVTSGSESADQAYTLKISPLVVTTLWDLPDAFVGKSYTQTLTAANAAASPTWSPTSPLPPGLVLNPAGELAGIPETSGFYTVWFSVNDGTDQVHRNVNIRVSDIEITTPGELPNATQNAAYSTTVSATGGGGSYTFSSDSLPNGLSLDPSSGEISGSANTGQGQYSFNLTASDGSTSTTKRMAIHVIGVPPSLPTIGSHFQDGTIGAPFIRTAWAYGGGKAPFTWTAGGLPPGLSIRWGSGNTVSWVTPGDVEISGTPTAVGDYGIQLTVTDADGKTATQTFPLHTSPLLSHSPSLPNGVMSLPYDGHLRFIGGALPYTAVVVEGRLPEGVTLDPATLALTGTPVESGGFGFSVLVTDTASQTLHTDFFFSLAGSGGANVAINHDGNLGQITLNSYYSNQLSACCGSLAWSIEGGSLPPGLSFTDGLLSGLPTAEGTHTFLVRATDTVSGSFGQRQFTLVVTPLFITGNQTLANAFVNSSYNASLTAGGGSGSLTWTVAPRSFLPPGLTLSSGSLSGTPTASGHYNFDLTVTDSAGHFLTRSFDVSVYPEGTLPPISLHDGPDLGTFSIGEVQRALTASGGNGSYVWELVSGTLPDGTALRTDGPSWFSADASAGVIGVATTPGDYEFTLRVTSGSASVERTYAMRISPLVVTVYWDLPDTFVGKPFSYTMTAANGAGPGPLAWTAMSGLPPGVTLSPDGEFSGTPTASGSFNVWLEVSDGLDTVGRNVSIQVFDIEITTDGTLPNATQNASYSTTILATGGTAPYTFTSDFLPNGLVLDPSGTIHGTVNTGPGNYGFRITVTDDDHVSYVKQMAIDVIGVPPTLPHIGIEFHDGTLGWPYTQNAWVGDGGTAPFTWTATGLPPGLSIRWGSGNTVSWVTPGNVEITGAPTALGIYNVTLTVTDASGKTASNTFPLRITQLLQHSNYGDGTIFTPYSGKLRIIGGAQPYTAERIDGRLPAGLTFDPGTFIVSGTPVENGFFDLELLVTDDASHTLRTTYSLSIGGGTRTIGINHNGDLGYVTQGSSYSNQLSACCVPSYTWSLESGPASLPPGLSFSGGQLSGTPNTSGTYTFLVRAADGTNPDNFGQRQFTMIVTPLSVPGSFTLPDGFVDSAYSRSFTATGGTGPLTWTVVQNVLPPGLTLASSGTLSGTPTASGFFSFQLKVTDSAGHANTRWFGVSIYAVGDYPPLDIPIGPDLGVWPLGGVFIDLRATGGAPPYHFALTPGATAIPGMRVQDGPPLPTFIASDVTAEYLGVITVPGTYSTSIRVTDSAGNHFDRAVTITIPPLRNVSLFRPPKATLGQPYSFTFVAYGGSGNYSWTADNLPPGLTLETSGQLHGTPTASGSFFPTLRLEDLSTSDYVWEGFALVVDPFAIAPGGVLPAGTVSSFYSQTFSAAGCGAPCTWTTQGGTPSGLSLNSSSGTLSGTPNGTFNSSFTVQASGPGGTVQKIFSLRIVSSSPQPLAINNGSIGDRTVGDSTQVTLFASGGTAPYTWAVVSGSLPPGVSLVSPGEAYSANLAPGFSYLAGRAMVAGLYSFTLQVTDGLGATVTRAFTWHISKLLWMDFNLPLNPGAPLVYNTPYTHSLLVVGGEGTYTWTSVGNPLPSGLVVGSATGRITGTPTNTGSFSSGIQVVDEAGNSVFQNVNLFVSGPTSTLVNFGVGDNLGIAQQGFLFSRNLSPNGGSPPYTITALSPLPPGFEILTGSAVPSNFSPGSYVLSGVPLAAGTFSFTLRATDSAANIGVRTFTLRIADATLFSPTTLAEGSVSTPYSQTLLAWSAGGVSWSVAAGSSLPPGVTLSSTGLLGGTPLQAGDYNFSLNATDAAGAAVNSSFSLHVSNLTMPDAAILPVAIAGVPYTYTFTATGNSGPVTWSATGLPFGFTLSSTGTLSGTTTATASAFTFTIRATDGGPALSRRFTLYARTPNAMQLTFPLVSTALPDATAGQSVAFNLNPNSGVPPYTASIASGALPTGLGLVAGDILPPNRNPGVILLAGAPQVAGPYTFDVLFTDSAGSQMRRTFTLRVTSMGILQSGVRTAVAGTPYSFQLTAIGGTAPYEFSMLPVGLGIDMLPPGLTLSPSGLLSGTTTSTGSYSFSVHARDALGNTVTRVMGFDVTSSAGVEVISGNPLDGPVGWGRSESLAAINVNGGSATYSWSLVSGVLPPGTALMPDFSPGTTRLAGQPTAPGTYVYTLRATDTANGSSADHQFTFRVSPMQVVSPAIRFQAPDLPSGNVGSPYSFTFKVAGGTPLYTFSESPFSPLPSGLTLSSAGVLSGTPLEVGNFTITPIIADSAGHTVNAPSMNLVITPPGVPSPFTTVTVPRTLFDASLGVPYSLPLDAPYSTISRRGVAPYSWALSGGSLPPGIALLPGANGVPNQIGGVSSTPGTYSFTLTATDASGQSSSLVASLKVSRLALTPDVAPPGIVGAPYSVSLVPSGGTPPYAIQLDPTGDLPPGLGFTSGLLSGTPTYPGNFSLFVTATDSLGATVSKPYKITIDNAAGQSPALSLAPRPIQLYHEQGTPAPAPVTVSVDTTSGALPFTLAVSGLPFASLTATSGTTSTTVGLDIDVSSLGPGTYVGMLGARAPAAANLIDAVPVTVTIAPPTPCSYTLNPSAGSQPAAGGSGSFDVAAGATCAWTATTSTPWITITAGSGTGAGSVSYSVELYGGTTPRSGTIVVNGASYTVTQFGSNCSFAINPVDFLAPAGGGTAFIAVTASAPACPPWTATGLSATPSSGSGDGGVTVTIPPNPTASTVLHTATIAGQTLTVTQAGVGCDLSLSPYDASAPAEGGAGSVTITTPADCPYDTVLGPSWITVTSPVGGSGIGSGTLVYSVEPNSTTESRSGSLTIGGQTFQVTQDGLACSVTIDTSALGAPYGPAGGTGFVGITTNGTNCSWTASSGAPWGTMVPSSGTGNATISVHADSNALSVTPRSTDLTIAGQTVTILQSGTACTYSLQSPSGSVPAAGGSGSVGVIAPSVCTWTAVTNTPAWLTISASGTAGSASVAFVAQPNTSASPRSGTLTIAGLTYTVNQAGAACSYTLNAVSPTTVSSDGVTDFFTFSTTASGCAPSALSYVGWITTTTTFGGGAGRVDFTVLPNPATAVRVGTIQVGSQTLEIRQSGGACGYSLNAYGALFDKHGGTSSVLGSPTGLGCTPVTGTDQPSIILLDPLTGPVSNIFTQGYHVTPYDSLTIATRRARITFGGQIFTVKQTSW